MACLTEKRTASSPSAPTSSAVLSPRATATLFMLILAVVILLYSARLLQPRLWGDDFTYLADSWTWSSTVQHLWVPCNEHAMPLGRLLVWGLVYLAGRPTALLPVTACASLIAHLLGVGLVFLLVSRERGHFLPGLLAMAIFGLSSLYNESVMWFSCCFGLVALDCTLLALLAAQRWRRDGRWLALTVCAAATAIAPAWSASGILAGPLSALYLIWPRFSGASKRLDRSAAVPLMGSALFLLISLPRTARAIVHAEHYGGRTAFQAFQPWSGLLNTGRSLVGSLLLGQFGVPPLTLPLYLVFPGLLLMAAAMVWWWRHAACTRLLAVGLAFILGNDLLVYSARALWPFEMIQSWGRYHLFPQLGLALVACGGLRVPPVTLFARPVRAMSIVTALLLAVNLPRNVPYMLQSDPGVRHRLRQIEAMDARCVELGIDAATAHAVLKPLPIPEWDEVHNGWTFLRGSPGARGVSLSEARRLLVR